MGIEAIVASARCGRQIRVILLADARINRE